MANSSAKKTKAKSKKNKSTGLVCKTFLVLFSIVISVVIFDKYTLYKELKEEEAVLLTQISEQELEQVQLNSQKDYYTSDAYIEESARNQLGLVKPNEKVFINRAEK